MARCAQPLQDSHPVQLGQHDVQHDGCRHELGDRLQPRKTIVGAPDGEVAVLELELHQPRYRGVVLHDQYASPVSHPLSETVGGYSVTLAHLKKTHRTDLSVPEWSHTQPHIPPPRVPGQPRVFGVPTAPGPSCTPPCGERLRIRIGRDPQRGAGIVGSQLVKTTSVVDERRE
jgi:hypothetical protein